VPNRILKETICTSCEIDDLSVYAERLFYRLVVQCDDFGRMDARLPILRAKCFPLKIDKVKEADIKKWLKELSDNGLIKIYFVDNKPYLYFVNWDKHQQKRANYSKYPAPDDGVISDDINCNQEQSNVPENREARSEKREADQDGYSKEFETFWAEYPRKKEKKAAYTKFKATKNKGIDAGKLILAACNYRKECEADCTAEKFIKLPRTFLGPDEHWREYLKTPVSPKSEIKDWTGASDAELYGGTQ
jgi:hypothetical protein